MRQRSGPLYVRFWHLGLLRPRPLRQSNRESGLAVIGAGGDIAAMTLNDLSSYVQPQSKAVDGVGAFVLRAPTQRIKNSSQLGGLDWLPLVREFENELRSASCQSDT